MKNYLQVNRALAAEKNFRLVNRALAAEKNFRLVNRALAAEKNLNYFNLNQIKSNPDGEPTVNRQSRLMSYRGYLKNLAIIFAVLVMSMANIGMAWGASGVITAASTTDLGKGNTPRYVVEQAGVGRLMKNATESSEWSGESGKLETGSKLFALQTYNAISSIVITGYGTGNDRTFSSMRVGTTTDNYAAATAIGNGTMSKTESSQTITITPSSIIAANSYVEITLSGNIYIYSVELVYAPSCVAPSNVTVAETETWGWRYTTGETIKLTATATGGSGGSYTYQWKKKTGPSTWKDLSDGADATDGGTFSGTTSANLEIRGCTSGNAGTYKCVVSTGAECSTESNEYWVRVFSLNGNYGGSSFVENPIVWSDEFNGTATITLNANSVYEFKVTDNDGHWYGKNTPINKDEDNFWIYRLDETNVTMNTGKVTGTYTFTVNIYHANDDNNPYCTLTAVRYPKMTIYMSGGNTTWCEANPVFFAHTYGQADNDVKMTAHACESGLFYADVPSYNTKVTFTRQRPGSESIAWNGDNFWNKSKDEIVIGSNNKFTCTGWDNKEGVFSGSTYSPSTYTITFASNGSDGGSAMSNVTAIPCDENRTLAANTWTKTGYTFAGWVADVDVKVGGSTKTAGTVLADGATIQNITSNITLTAQWTPKTINITLNQGEHGAANQSATVAYDAETLTSITHVTPNAGYFLTGYYDGETKVLDANGTFAEANVSGYITNRKWTKATDCTLTAKWECVSLAVNIGGTPATPAEGEPLGTAYGTLTCSATTGVIASYQWKQNTSATTEGAVNAEGTGAKTASFSPNPAAAGTYYYYCVATDACGNSANTSFSGAFKFNESADPCSEPAEVTNEIARFFVPCNQAAGDAWNPSGVDASTGSNTFTITNNLGGSGDFGGDNWKRNATTGFKYGKMQKNTTIQLQLKSDSRFQAGDIVTVYVNGTSNNVKMNTGSDVSFGESAASGYDGEYTHTKTLAADNIEGDGSIIIKRTDAIFINRIIVTRPPVAASITATLLTPAFMPTGASGVQIGVEINGAGDGWKYRVKNGTGGYEGPDNTPYTTTTWTMTSTIGAGANTYVVELYDGTGTKQATSNTITVTGETTYPVTITAGANGTVSPSGIVQANGSHIKPEITATPNSGYRFLKWTLNNSNATLADASSATTTITNTTGACEITANFAAAATPIISWDLKVNASWSDVNGTSYDASITGPATSTSNITVTNDNKADKTSKLELSSDGSRYVEFTFEVACGKKLTPDSIVMQVLNVGGSSGGKMTHKAELSDTYGHSINGTIQPGSDGTLTKLKVTNGGNVYFQGAVSLKVWAWNHSGTNGTAFRMGKDVDIYGAISDQASPAATITWNTQPANGQVGDPDFAYDVTCSDGSAVTVTSANTTYATIVGGKLHYAAAGTTHLVATATDACGNVVVQNSSDFTVSAAAPTYTVTHSLTNVTATSGATGAGAATEGVAYDAVFAANSGYVLPSTITVTIGGSPATVGAGYTWNASTGAFQVPAAQVTGDIVVTIAGETAPATKDIYYGHVKITDGALVREIPSGTTQFFTNIGGTVANNTEISLSSTPSTTDMYYNSNNLTDTELSKLSNWSASSSSNRYIRGLKFANGTTYTLALGTKVASAITFYGWCGSASKTMTVGGETFTSNATKKTFETHDFTKSGGFTDNVSITQTGDFYGIIVVTVAALPFCTTPTMPSDVTSTICEADSKPTWNATPENAATITGASQTISYSWKKEGSDTELATTATYTPTTNGTYKCTVTVSKASHISRTAVMTCTLVINSAPDKPTISGNTTGTVGNNVLLTASTTIAAASYQWYKDGVAIGSATSATYNANEASAGSYDYTVTATNSCGTSSASNAHTVTFSEAAENVTPIISASLESACVGATITLTATTYHPSATLTWYKDGVTTGQTGTTYTISTAAAGDAGVYTLKSVLGGTEDLTSDGITITINTAPAAFSDFRTAYSVDAEATSVTLNATATGATSYAWYSATKENATTGGVLLAEVTTTSYSASLAGVAEGKEYYFYCIAENACGNNSAAATTVTVTAVSLEECLDMTDASDAGAPELEGTYATLSGTTSGTSTVSSLTYIKLGSSSNYIQLEAETGYTFATVTAVLVANYSNQKMVYATSTNGSSWTYTEYTLSGDAKVRRTLVINVPANTKYVQIWRQADGKGQANTLYVDPEICYEMEMECATPPTFQFEKPASTKITADSYTIGSGAYTSPMLNKGSLAGSVTYSSSDESVATVNSSGVVTILDAGSTTIKAIYAGDATYCTTQAYYVLTVSCQIPAPELTTDGSSVACSSSITITARNSSTHAAYAGDAAGGTYEWYRNGEVMVGEDDASITVEVTGTYYVVYTKDDCSQRSTNVATVTSEVREPSAQRLTPFQYYKYNHTYYQVGDPDIPGGTDPDIVGPMRHLFKVTPSRLVDGKPCQVKKEIIRADVSLGAATVVTDSYIKYEDNKDGSYNVMLDLNALTTLNKVEERLVVGDTLVLTATPFDACSDPATSETKSIKVYVIDESKHPLAFIVSGASGDGTKTKGQLVLNGDFLTGYNKADLCLQTGLTTWNSSAELPLYTGLKADPKFIVVPVNGYATFNQLNYEPFELLLLTDFVVTDGSGTKSACASIVNDMAALVDYRPILSLKAHMAKKELANWAAKGFTTLPEVPENNPVNTMKVLCYAHPMFDGASGAVTDPETGLTTITMTSGGGFDKNKALQGFQSAGLSGFVFIASIDGGSKGTLYSCIERQNKIDARMVVISVNGNAHSQINSYGQSAIIKTLEYLLDTDPVKVSDCTVTFDNGASYADYNEEAYHAAGGTGSKGDGLWATAANWSTKKLPLADQNIKINADVTVTGDRSVLSVRFNDNYKMTIAPSGSLSVPGYISKVVDGELVDITETNRITIQSNDVQTGVLIHSQKSGTLAATVQLVSKSYSERVEEDGKIKKKKYWQYIGLPVQSALAEDAFYGAYTYKYNEPSGWEKKGTGTTLEEFWGIGLSVDNIALGISSPVTFNISGALALATDRDIELTKTAEGGDGENMIGNSWTAPIHLVNMTDDDFENATATIYLFNTGRSEETAVAGTGDNGTPGQWRTIPVAASKLDPWLGPKVIPAMQAFEVDVKEEESSGTLHLNYDKHVRNIGTPEEEHAAISAPKRYRTEEPSMMRLRVADSATYTDLYLIEGEELSDEFDNGYDGKYQQCDGRSATLYALSPIGNMAVLAQQSINNTAIVFRPGRQNEYTFTFGYNGEVAYYLNDLLLEQSTEIREGNEYRFTCNEGDMESRFVVSTTPFGAPDITTGIGNTGHPEKVQKIMYKDHIYIIRAGRVYDIVGKEVR